MLPSLLADLDADGDGSIAILVARRGERLDALAADLHGRPGIRATPLAGDLAAPGAAHRIADAARADGRGVEFLVNNAGFGASGTVAECPPSARTACCRSTSWRCRSPDARERAPGAADAAPADGGVVERLPYPCAWRPTCRARPPSISTPTPVP